MSTIKAKAFQHPSATSNNITFNSDGTHTVNAAYPTTSKNLIINGAMNVWQRSANATGVNTSGYHSADRWAHGTDDLLGGPLGTWTQSRSTDVPSAQGFGYSLKMDCTTADASPAADDFLLFQQRIEGQNLQHLLKGTSSAKKVTLSFWVKSNKTGTYIIELYDVDNQRQISKSYTIDSASTWEKKEIIFDGDTNATDVFDNDNNWSLGVNWWLGSGSTYSSGTLNTTWNNNTVANRAVGGVNLGDSTSNEWYITGIQLEVGEQATGFEFEPFEAILTKCQRYYEKSYEYDTALGTVTFNGAYYDEVGGTNYPRIQAHYGVRKRTRVPNTMTIYNPNTGTAGQMYIWDNGTNRNYSLGNTRYTFNSVSTEGQNNAFNLNNRAWGAIHYAADFEI